MGSKDSGRDGRRATGAATHAPTPSHSAPPGKRTAIEKTYGALPPPPALPASTPSRERIRSSDPRLKDRAVSDVSHELKGQLLQLVGCGNRMVEGMFLEKRDLVREREDNPLASFADENDAELPDRPTAFDRVIVEWYALLGAVAADVHTPDDAAHVMALATKLIADTDKFEALAIRTSAIWNALEDDAKSQMHRLAVVLDVVNGIKVVGLGAAILASSVYLAPIAAAMGPLEGAGAMTLGGATVGGAYRAADVGSSDSTLKRTWEGMMEGGAMAPAAKTGEAVEVGARSGIEWLFGEEAASSTAGKAVTGAVNYGVAGQAYGTTASLAHGDDLGTAMKVGVESAAIGAPFGAVMGAVAAPLMEEQSAGATPPPVEVAPDTELVSRDEIANELTKRKAAGATVRDAGRDATTGQRTFEALYPDGRRVRIVEDAPARRPGADGSVPTAAQAAEARAAADRAAEIQAQRDAQLTALIEGHQGPIVADTVIMGGGQGGTLAYATSNGAVGAVPGVDVTEIPQVFNVAPDGSMFARHGDFPIGQGAPELAPTDARVRSAGEFTENHGAPVEASNYNRSLAMTGYDSGMTTFKAKVTQVEVRPPEGWGEGVPADAKELPIRITAGGKTIYVKRFIASGGLGAPRPLDKPGTPLVARETELAAAGKLVYAQESLTLPAGAKQIVVIGDGATASWAAEQAIEEGAEKVYWIGKTHAGPTKAPAAVRSSLVTLGLDDSQIELFWRGYNSRNAPTFRYITSGRIELHADVADLGLEPAVNRVQVTLKNGMLIEADGVVSATGQVLDVPKGMDAVNTIEFRMVTVDVGGRSRVVALDGYSKLDGHALGIRIEGAQMAKAGPLLDPDQRLLFEASIRQQSGEPSVPSDSRDVAGSIYQSNIDIPLANQQPLGGAEEPRR